MTEQIKPHNPEILPPDNNCEDTELKNPEIKQTPKNPFVPDIYDLIFAIAAFVLGYMFSRWLLFSWRGWGTAVFTVSYLLSALVYLSKKGIKPNLAAWFWFAVTMLTGISYALWDGIGLTPVRPLFLFCAAVYWVIAASGRAVMGKTGNFLLIDGLNAVILIPFKNFLNQYASFALLRKQKKPRVRRLPAVLGVLFALLLITLILPLLERADSGGFSKILNAVRDLFAIRSVTVIETLVYCAFAIPSAAYIYGLISGAAHNRATRSITPDNAKKCVAALRVLQPATVYIALFSICAVYLIFILCQIPYFFSAFTGKPPGGWLVYAEYARRGFFELCQLAALNLAVITVGNVTCKKTGCAALKAFNIALALITLLLIATAASKMALYIDAYGLSIPRLLPCVFMAFMAAVFISLIALQWRSFSIVRFALVTGALMFCAVCLSNPDALVVRYNTARYLSGTLSGYDDAILYRAGNAGVPSAIEVYNKTRDEKLKAELSRYLDWQKQHIGYLENKTHAFSLETHEAKELLYNFQP